VEGRREEERKSRAEVAPRLRPVAPRETAKPIADGPRNVRRRGKRGGKGRLEGEGGGGRGKRQKRPFYAYQSGIVDLFGGRVKGLPARVELLHVLHDLEGGLE
jgi:hypothetical protein